MGDDIFAGGSATFDETTGTALLDASGVWADTGASSPPPSAQPDFNSPVTQDSMGILDTISTGVDSLSTSLGKILGSATNLQSAAATANAQTQANQLAA